MRSTINEFLLKNQERKDIRFMHNDMWSFESKNLSVVKNFKSSENMIWGYSYGLTLQNILPIIYSVSYFNIGRLEQFRKFFLLKKSPIIIFNAGHVGYDNLPEAHRFTNPNEEDPLLKQYNFTVLDQDFFKSKKHFLYFLNSLSGGPGGFKDRYYIKLGRDNLWLK